MIKSLKINIKNNINYMDLNTVKYITQNITPEEAQYVSDVKSTLSDVNNKDKEDDILYIIKIMGFAQKILTLAWPENNSEVTAALQNLKWSMETYRDEIVKNIQSIIGIIDGTTISKLELPVNNNILSILNELKICVNNWFELHKDNIEYEGTRYITSKFLADVHNYIYKFRLLKVSDKGYAENMSVPNPGAPVSFVF